jgi:hypothetical protein
MTEQDPAISTLPDVALNKEHICKSCGNKFTGFYCNQCGEKILLPRDRTFKTFVSNIRQAISLRDNRFLKSLLLIVTKPGFLSKEIVEGRRVNYVKPLQLFFALNLVYFLFPLLQLFNTSFDTQMYLRTHSPLVQEMVKHKLVTDGYSLQAFRLLYNDKSTSMAKLLIIVFVLLASLPFTIVYRKRNRYFTDHLTLSVELVSFNLLMNALFLSLFLIIINKLIHFTHTGWEKYLDDLTLTLIFALTNVYFLFSAGRTFYGQRGFKLIIKVLLGMLGLFITLEAYRLVLFLVTFWAL